MLGMVMQLLFNPAGAAGPSKSDAIDTDPVIGYNFNRTEAL